MKKILLFLFSASLIISLNSYSCFSLSADNSSVNLITNQGKTGIVKEYSNFKTAIDNAKNGDTVEIISNISLNESLSLNKSITITSGSKREGQIIVGGNPQKSNEQPKQINNVSLKNNGEKNLISFENIYVNGEYITITGDVNLDECINILDLVRIKKELSKNIFYSVPFDINLDLTENAEDLVVLRNMLLEKY